MVQKSKSPIIVCALEDEYKNTERNVLYTGMGKIRSISSLAKVDPFSYDLVINLGSCGSRNVACGTLLRIKHHFEWDRTIPREYDDFCIISENPMMNEKYPTPGIKVSSCATGDRFVEGETEGGINIINKDEPLVYDMESFALAYFCLRIKKPFLCFKYVTDSCNETEWENNIDDMQLDFEKLLVDIY